MADSSSNRSRTWIWVLILLLVIAAGLYFTLGTSRDRVTVTTARVRRDPIVRTISTNGRVEPLDEFQPHSPISTTVKRLDVQLGQTVSRGQPLLQLDAADARAQVATAQNTVELTSQDLRNMAKGGTHDELLGEHADLQNAQAQLQDAMGSLKALQALQAQGAASANEVTSAQQHVSDAQAKVNQIQTRLQSRYGAGDFAGAQSQHQRAEVELAAAENNLSQLDIRSPMAGTVYSLPIARYEYVTAGEPLLSIANLRQLRVRAYFDEPEIGNLAEGQPVTIVWDAKVGRVWHGRVIQAPTTIINIGSRNVGEALISVDDADGVLLPNTNVTVTVTTLRLNDVLSLPREALHTQGSSNFVYRIVGDHLVQTPVSLGVVTLTRVQITGGLKEGDLVALGAISDVDLQNGLAVRTQSR